MTAFLQSTGSSGDSLGALSGGFTVPAIIADAGERASMRFIEFFTANIRNPNTRRAYGRARLRAASVQQPTVQAADLCHTDLRA